MTQRTEGPCEICDNPVTPDDNRAYEEIRTWVQRPQMHGAVLRTYTSKVAHEECIKKALAGIAPDQESLI
jgi:hypothetical protein